MPTPSAKSEILAEIFNGSAQEIGRIVIASSLYERLALSRDKAGIKALSQDVLAIENPSDVVKNPYVLELLDLEEKSAYSLQKRSGVAGNLKKSLTLVYP